MEAYVAEQLVAGFGTVTQQTVALDAGFDWPMNVWTDPVDFSPAESRQDVATSLNPSLGEMAQFIFGIPTWPAQITTPYAWIELVVSHTDEVSRVLTHLRGQGYEVLRVPDVELSGQMTAVAISPLGLLTRVTYSPALRNAQSHVA